jgi:hypothetical protein
MITEFTSHHLAEVFQFIIIAMAATFVARELCFVSKIEDLKAQLKDRDIQLENIHAAYRASLHHITALENPSCYQELPDDPNVISLNAWKAERSTPRRKAL